jgi:hypothetical protein
MPTFFKNMVKTVIKDTWRYGYDDESFKTQQTSNDDYFLLSESEVTGELSYGSNYPDTYGRGNDGYQYEYYKTNANRIKCVGINGTTPTEWWLRTGYAVKGSSYNNSSFRAILTDGTITMDSANSTNALSFGCVM